MTKSKQVVLTPKHYCINCNRVMTNWTKDGLCDYLTIGTKYNIDNLEEIELMNHIWLSYSDWLRSKEVIEQ